MNIKEEIYVPDDIDIAVPQVVSWDTGDISFENAKSYLDLVRAGIESKKAYPEKARTRRLEGQVTVYFIITYKGEATDLKIIKSSNSDILDESALKAIKDAAPFPIPPAHLFNGEVKIKININFELEESL